MSLKKCKVYNDGSHFIAIRPTKGNKGARRSRPPEEVIIVEEEESIPEKTENIAVTEQSKEIIIKESNELKELNNMDMGDYIVDIETGELIPKERTSTRSDEFLKYYRQSVGMGWYEQVGYIVDKMRPYLMTRTAYTGM